jgi:bile acid-coenzyme A ligase
MDAMEIQKIIEASPQEPFVRTMARLADEAPDFVAIVHEEDSITRRELERRSNRLARVLMAEGVECGDYVAISLANGIPFYVAYWAVIKVGGVPLPLSPRMTKVERDAIIELAKPTVVIGVDVEDQPGRHTLPADFRPDDSVSDAPLPEVISPSWKAPASGGSTGRPKVIRSGSPAIGSPELNGLLWGFEPTDVQAVVAPLYHNAALQFSVWGLLLGQRLVVFGKFDAEVTLQAIERHSITWMIIVPTMMHRMHRVLESGRASDLSSVRMLWHSSARCADWLKQAWIDLLGAERVFELYGGTEGMAAAVITGPEWLEHRGSVGRAVVGEMKVLGEDGQELPAGEVGDIYMRGPMALPSYEYLGAESKRQNGWESIGDLGWTDEDGYLYISDRRVDMIISGGANVYPAEVEAAIDQHPKVGSSVVVGLDDADLGQRVHAVVQAAPGTSVGEVLEFLADRLVRYKIPRSVEFTDQALRDDAGKVRRGQIREEANERMRARA